MAQYHLKVREIRKVFYWNIALFLQLLSSHISVYSAPKLIKIAREGGYELMMILKDNDKVVDNLVNEIISLVNKVNNWRSEESGWRDGAQG